MTWSEITGTNIDIDRLRELAGSMRTETMLANISMLSIIMGNTPLSLNTLRQQQLELAPYLLRDELAEKAKSLIERGTHQTLIHDEQLLYAARLAWLYGQPGPPDQLPPLYTLGELLLGINDIFNSRDDTLGSRETLSPAELEIILLLRNYGLNRNEQFRYLLVRYYDLLISRPKIKPKNGRSLNDAFKSETGIELEEYLAFALLYWALFYGITDVRTLQEKKFLNVINMLESQIQDPLMRERCKNFFSRNKKYFSAEYSKVDFTHSSNLPIKRYPFFRMENDSAIPISYPLLIEKSSMGIYWILFNHFMEFYPDNKSKGIKEYTSYLGKLFQDYASDLLARIYNNRSNTLHYFYDENSISIDNSKHASKKRKTPKPDGIIISDNCAIILEISTASIRTVITENDDLDGFKQDIKGKFLEKIDQLSDAFDHIANGSVIIPNLDIKSISNVYQVLVLLHPLPQSQGVWDLIRQLANHSNGQDPDDIHPPDKPPYPQTSKWYPFGRGIQLHQPQILTIEELEMLEPLLHSGENSLPDLLNRKLASSTTASMSMKNFLLLCLKIQEKPNEAMLTLYNTTIEKIRENLSIHINFVSPEDNT